LGRISAEREVKENEIPKRPEESKRGFKNPDKKNEMTGDKRSLLDLGRI